MKLKDIKLLKTKSPAELKAMLPSLAKQRQEFKLKKTDASEIKYQIAVIKTLCKL